MKLRNLMYIGIIIICIICISIGIMDQVEKDNGFSKLNTATNNIASGNTNNTYNGKTQEELNKEFNNIFDNKLNKGKYDTSQVQKMDDTKEIIYTAYGAQEENEKYDVDINLPVVNIKSDAANKFNAITTETFAKKTTEVLYNTQQYTIYSVTYTGYINEDILSIIIKSNLKEGNNAQRVIVQTYNYNLSTGEECSIDDLINQRGISKDEVSKKIDTQIKEAVKEANSIQISGYEVFVRDINSSMYDVDKTSTYYLGANGGLYIIYAYGNEEFTSEVDVIVI